MITILCTSLILPSAINAINSNYYDTMTTLLWWLNAKRLLKQLGCKNVHVLGGVIGGPIMLNW